MDSKTNIQQSPDLKLTVPVAADDCEAISSVSIVNEDWALTSRTIMAGLEPLFR